MKLAMVVFLLAQAVQLGPNDAGDLPCDFRPGVIQQASILCYELKPSSPYQNKATDGGPVGVENIQRLKWVEDCARSGDGLSVACQALLPAPPTGVEIR